MKMSEVLGCTKCRKHVAVGAGGQACDSCAGTRRRVVRVHASLACMYVCACVCMSFFCACVCVRYVGWFEPQTM